MLPKTLASSLRACYERKLCYYWPYPCTLAQIVQNSLLWILLYIHLYDLSVLPVFLFCPKTEISIEYITDMDNRVVGL